MTLNLTEESGRQEVAPTAVDAGPVDVKIIAAIVGHMKSRAFGRRGKTDLVVKCNGCPEMKLFPEEILQSRDPVLVVMHGKREGLCWERRVLKTAKMSRRTTSQTRLRMKRTGFSICMSKEFLPRPEDSTESAPAEQTFVSVFVVGNGGRSFSLKVEDDASIFWLKELIEKETGVAAEDQVINHFGKLPPKAETHTKDCQMENHSTVHPSVRVAGGAKTRCVTRKEEARVTEDDEDREDAESDDAWHEKTLENSFSQAKDAHRLTMSLDESVDEQDDLKVEETVNGFINGVGLWSNATTHVVSRPMEWQEKF